MENFTLSNIHISFEPAEDTENGDVQQIHEKLSSIMVSPIVYILSALALLLTWIVGTIGNSLVLLIVANNKQLRTPINMILVNLAFCDFGTAFIGSPFPMISAYLNYWPFGNIGCQIYGFGMALGGIGSINTLMVLAFERFLMISRPCQIRPIEMKHTIGIIIGIWIYSLILTLPPLLGWGSYDFEGPGISCSINWESETKLVTSYIVFLFMLGFIIPVIVITGSYYLIIRTVKSASGDQSRAVSRAEQRVVFMIATMVACFLFAWTPYALVSLLASSGFKVSPIVTLLPALIAKSSACYNPLIYVGLNTQFRLAWRKLFGLPILEREAETATGATAATANVGPQSQLNNSTNPGTGTQTQNLIEIKNKNNTEA